MWGLPAGRAAAVDAAVAAGAALIGIAGTGLATRHHATGHPLGVSGALLLGAAAVPLLWRRRWPVTAFAVTCALTLAYPMLGYPMGPIWAALIIAFGSAVVLGRRGPAYTILVLGFLGFGWLVPAVTDRKWPSLVGSVTIAAWLLLLLAVSEIIRYRRALAGAERARQAAADRIRAEEVERRAAEDRLAIARELHDVLGHRLSVITVQAGAGLELIGTDPGAATDALAAIRAAGRDALLDVQAFLDSLRRPGDAAPLRPLPHLADLDDLVSAARGAGLPVQTRVVGRARPVPAAVDLAACRVIQEALTNVLRHAGRCATRVTVTHEPEALAVRVENSAGDRPLSTVGGGRGVTGMRERVESLGGTLDAGPRPDGGWTVAARIPVPVGVAP